MLAGVLLLTGCASLAPSYRPAGPEEATSALTAWERALARAESLGDARLLYEARLAQGVLQVPGTLAVVCGPGWLEATLSGPFGAPVARFEDGALRGEKVRPIRAEPEELRAVLAGVWRAGPPRVAGIADGTALLRWEGPEEEAEGVLDLASARLRSLRILRPEGGLAAAYSGRFEPWPERVALEDLASGHGLKLSLLAAEPLEPPVPAAPSEP